MGRQVFTAGEILTAANMNDLGDATVMVFDDATARATAIPTPVEGMVTYLKEDEAVTVFDGSAFVGLGGGKFLQVVRATDATDRITSSGSFVDASISVTITPEKSDSDILLLWVASARDPGGEDRLLGAQITDSSNVAISGAENMTVGNTASLTSAHFSLVLVGFATPGSTSAQTFKGRFRSDNGLGGAFLSNSQNTGQLYAIEVSA